jgi:hypothetical protein
MKNRLTAAFALTRTFLASLAMLALLPAATMAQVPVDENGDIIGDYQPQSAEKTTGNEDIPLLSTVDLEELVGPIALYPDDLLAIVLPAAAYPLQIVDAARFLEALENDPSLKPDPDWDDSVVALINYPEVVELLNDDIDWTWRLGEAVVSQQADVVAAIETFRDRAYAAGNLKSDSYQNVSRDEGVIEITPVAEDVIYVPYYEPERVVVYQPRPVYYYYPRAYPVYYYPYSAAHAFHHRYFWGVTTAFTIGWYSDSLHVFHHSYHGHPYYGHSYWDRWWYRRPSISIYNTNYVGSNTNVTVNRYYGGDRWRPRHNRRDYQSERRVTRNRHYPASRDASATNRVQRISGERRTAGNNTQRRERVREPIAFRERPQTLAVNRTETTDRRRQTTRVTPRNAADATRTRTETARQQRQTPRDRTQRPRERRLDSRERRSESATRQPRTEPVVQARRTEPVSQARRVTPPSQSHRSEPQRQVSRAEPRRQQTVERKGAPAAEARKSSEQKSVRGSSRTSQRREQRR